MPHQSDRFGDAFAAAMRLVPPSLPAGGRGWSAAVASILEAAAAKPGNVHPAAAFPDLSFDDLASAGTAIGPVLEAAAARPLGETIRNAVAAARTATRSNANLGIVLVVAPLAAVPDDAGPPTPAAVERVLGRLDAGDAAAIWEAIRTAQPGGLGTSGRWDLADPPPADIRAAMRHAAKRDTIARLWGWGYDELFAGPVADLAADTAAGVPLETAIVRCHLRQLARRADSLISRRHGRAAAAEVSARAADILTLEGTAAWPHAVAEFDAFLRRPRRLNPGTTADLVAGALYILLLDGRLRGLPPCATPSPSPPTTSMTDRYLVKLRKAVHVFCAGHFITLADDLCEPVHGHNWTVGIDVEGPPGPHGMVVDFIALRDAATAIIGRLDHRMLLPTESPFLDVSTAVGPLGNAEVTVRFSDRRWVFPADECVLLPVANTTAEWIAGWIGGRLQESLAAAGIPLPGRLRVEVDECLGQSAGWEREP